MSAFRYEAVDALGATKKGVLDADSPRAARSELRGQGLTPIRVASIREEASDRRRVLAFGDKLSTPELALFTRQLASLLQAGLPLEQAFSALLEQAERNYVRDLVASVRSEVTSGASLSVALSRHPRDFSDMYRALVSSGEQIGRLSQVLSRLADYLERRNALVQKVRMAFAYPAIVTVVAVCIVIFLLTYVVPQIVSVFANTRQKLPLLTVIMLSISNFVRGYGWAVVLLLVAAAFTWRAALKVEAVKLRWHAWLLTAPLYGRFERSLNTARFASTLAITTGSGVPILRALDASRDTLSNMTLRAEVTEATLRVREGWTLARALSQHKHFPPVLVHMIRAGEATGELASMLERASNVQEQDLERRAVSMAGLLEPILILGMGVMVLLIVLAVLMPIIEINQLVR